HGGGNHLGLCPASRRRRPVSARRLRRRRPDAGAGVGLRRRRRAFAAAQLLARRAARVQACRSSAGRRANHARRRRGSHACRYWQQFRQFLWQFFGNGGTVMPQHNLHKSPPARRAAVLLVVLVVSSVLSLAAYTYSQLMIAEYEAAELYGRRVQSRALAESGVAMLVEFLRETYDIQLQYGGHYDNPRFQGQLVYDGGVPADRGRFTIIAARIDEEGRYAGLRYGIEDESARLNLQALLVADAQQENGGRDLLMALPGMTESIADAILDWIDPDDEPREFGAETEY